MRRASPASIGELSCDLQALGIEGRWTETRARECWNAHPPGALAEAALASLDVELSSDETRSRGGRSSPAPAS